MGLQSVLKWDPVRVARDWIASPNEKARRRICQRRRLLLIDHTDNVVREEINRLFTDPTVRDRVMMFAHLAKSVTLFKRVMRELARPVYLVPPTRTVEPSSAQDAYKRIVAETHMDAIAPKWLITALATGASFAYPRYVPRLDRIVIDVISADAVSVIPDPDDPCRELAVIYDKPVYLPDGGVALYRVYWDDEVSFQLDDRGMVQPFEQGGQPFRENTLGVIPLVSLHPYERLGDYWCTTAAEALVEANMAECILTTLALRGLKARGFNQIVVTGDAMRFPKGQAMDEESAILAPEGTGVIELANAADASNYLTLVDAIESRAAAEYGISRARLNREKADADDTGLTEQRAEMIKIMADAERELFAVIKVISTSASTNTGRTRKQNSAFGIRSGAWACATSWIRSRRRTRRSAPTTKLGANSSRTSRPNPSTSFADVLSTLPRTRTRRSPGRIPRTTEPWARRSATGRCPPKTRPSKPRPARVNALSPI